MEIKCLDLGLFRTNCYIAYDSETKKAVIIDPAAQPAKIKQVISELGLVPEAILLTHGHFDHIMAADVIRKEYHIPLGLMDKEAELLPDPKKNCSATLIDAPFGMTADETFVDGQILPYLDGQLKVIATPGHTAGCCCYYAERENVLFSGDTLFCCGVGRTDLPTAIPSMLYVSIRERLFALPEDTLVLPGHGEDTTIGYEKQHNPFVS